MRFKEMHIDAVPVGTMIYGAGYVALGVVRINMVMNGNCRSTSVRALDNGRWADRFAYRRAAMYRELKDRGGNVFVRIEK